MRTKCEHGGMPMARSTAHAHTTFCDGQNSTEEMAAAALARGFVSMGFSEHAPQRIDPKYGMADEEGYIREVRRLQAEYEGRMAVYLGAEQDLYGQIERAWYDYVIGSVHYFVHGDEFCAIDGPREALDRAYRDWFHADGLCFARAYYEQVLRCVGCVKPDIVGHLDLFRKHNGAQGRYVRTDSPAYRRVALDALRQIRESCALLEVNTGGIARGYMDTPYPEAFLLAAWREMGGRVILGSDCHAAAQVDAGYEQALALLEGLGYRAVTRLRAAPDRAGIFEEVPISGS